MFVFFPRGLVRFILFSSSFFCSEELKNNAKAAVRCLCLRQKRKLSEAHLWKIWDITWVKVYLCTYKYTVPDTWQNSFVFKLLVAIHDRSEYVTYFSRFPQLKRKRAEPKAPRSDLVDSRCQLRLEVKKNSAQQTLLDLRLSWAFCPWLILFKYLTGCPDKRSPESQYYVFA